MLDVVVMIDTVVAQIISVDIKFMMHTRKFSKSKEKDILKLYYKL